jgi:4-amino-4-deoxy-L-arabinose transferase-like glycosyltransferase
LSVDHVTGVLRRHAVFLAAVAGGLALRLYYQRTYPYAFFFSDSRDYVAAAADGHPFRVRPYGYSFLIKPFLDHPYAWLTLAQHLLGLALLVAGYLFLVRRGARPWLAGLAVLPWALDARVVTLEHYVLAESAFVAATAAGLMLLAWRERLGWLAATLGGLLLGFAAVTRTVGLPVLGLVAVYLLIRRPGVLRLVAFTVPVVAVLGGYLIWYHQTWGPYSFGQYQGRFLYARVMPIADCDRLTLTAEQRRLCMPDPPADWSQRPDQYLWSLYSPARRIYPTVEDDHLLGEFANTVIAQRPRAYLDMIAEQVSWHFYLRAPVTDGGACLTVQWIPPDAPGTECQARYYLPTNVPQDNVPPAFVIDNPGAYALHAYGEIVTTPGPLYAASALLALVAAVWRPRRRPWREAADALLFTVAGLGLIVVSVATSLFDYRYAVPAVLLIPLGAALSITRIAAVSKTRKTPPEYAEQQSSESDTTWTAPPISSKSPSSSPA